jgi:hypothetical protein
MRYVLVLALLFATTNVRADDEAKGERGRPVDKGTRGPITDAAVRGFMQPLLACAVIAAIVLIVRRGLAAAGARQAVHPAVEISAGAVTYVVAVLAIARDRARDLLALVLHSVGKPAEVSRRHDPRSRRLPRIGLDVDQQPICFV